MLPILGVILISVFLAGVIIVGVVEIKKSVHAMKALDETRKARGGKTIAEHIEDISRKTIKTMELDGKRIREAMAKGS